VFQIFVSKIYFSLQTRNSVDIIILIFIFLFPNSYQIGHHAR